MCEVRTTTQTQTVFDQSHYQRLIEARGETIRDVVSRLGPLLGLSTAIDAGCGLGFFAKTLGESGLTVRAFDGRAENVEEARRRYPGIPFEQVDIQDVSIARMGIFDLVLCFGLLYHLENPLLAFRHLRKLTGKALLLESMCLPEEKPWMLLREEASLADQSLTDVAYYASEGCLAKMMYRAGFAFVYRVTDLPDHDDFRDTAEHFRRRTVLLGTTEEISIPGFAIFPEPKESSDPWSKIQPGSRAFPQRVKNFLKKPTQSKYLAIARRVRRLFAPNLPIPLRLPFGAWWIAGNSALDYELMTNVFESAETQFVQRYLRPGMTVLDVGAHHGLYTLLASKCVGSAGTVIAIEPSPRERKRLEGHLKLNRNKNVRLESLALGSERGEADLFLVDGSEDWCNSLRPPAVTSKSHVIRVQVKRLDELLQELGVTTVDFIKIDVEGAELDALKGAGNLLRGSSRPVILAEVYDSRTSPWGYAAREIVQLLAQLDYQWLRLGANGSLQHISSELQSYDANLVAIPGERVDKILVSLGEKQA
jgi:FkbM family methyltransferase